MTKLTVQETQEIRGGEDCFLQCWAYEQAWDAYLAQPNGETYGVMMMAHAAWALCVNNIP